MKRIAVIGSGIEVTLEWLVETLKKERGNPTVNQSNHTVQSRENLYIIVTDEIHANEYEFQDYLIAPSYYTLVNYVKTRIRS